MKNKNTKDINFNRIYELWRRYAARLVATSFLMGFVPYGSGTAASFLVSLSFFGIAKAFLLQGLFDQFFFGWLVCIFVGVPLSFWAVDVYLQKKPLLDKNDPKRNDPAEIVADEVIGQMIALLPVAFFATRLAEQNKQFIIFIFIAFILFRLFDIWKPSFIGSLDQKNKFAKIPKGLFVMMDDIYAGAFAGIIVAVIILFYLG